VLVRVMQVVDLAQLVEVQEEVLKDILMVLVRVLVMVVMVARDDIQLSVILAAGDIIAVYSRLILEVVVAVEDHQIMVQVVEQVEDSYGCKWEIILF